MEERIRNIIIELFELKESEMSEDLKATDVSLWDSLNHLSLVTNLEDTFGIKLTMKEIQSMDSYSKIIETVKRHL